MRLAVLAREDQLPHPRQGAERIRVGGIIRTAAPESILVEGDVLLIDSAKDHAAQTAIADRQGLLPFHGGPAIPQAQRLVGRRRPTGETTGELRNLVAGRRGLGAGGRTGQNHDGERHAAKRECPARPQDRAALPEPDIRRGHRLP
jgi:hypothetical protein